MPRPILDDLELELVQNIATAEDEALVQHAVPALEGDFFQRLGRRATGISLQGVLTGTEVKEGLEKLREKFRAAAPVSFVADITTATRIEKVLIEELDVRELAGKPERFEYAFKLREFLPLPEPEEEEPPPIPPVPVPETATLEIKVIVEGESNFDFSQATVTVEGTQEDGTTLSRTLTNRENNVWTEEDFPPGNYTAKAVVTAPPAMAGSEPVIVPAAGTGQATITLRRDRQTIIAIMFMIHFRFDKALVEPCMRHVLQEVAEYARSHPDEKLVIVGHTDKVGPDEYNQSLSERRARSVYAYLTFGRDAINARNEWDQLRRTRASGVSRSLNDSWGVRQYQYLLQDLGYYPGNVNGKHDTATDVAVREFQSDKGLTVDGIVGNETWPALINDYLRQDNLNVPESQFLANCPREVLKWLGCGEQDPVRNTEDAWRPNRRTELLFVNADELPCDAPRPDTFDLPARGAVGSDWCLGPGDPNDRCCFLTRDPGQEGKWLVQPIEPATIVVRGRIAFEDDTPAANVKYVLIASDGEFMNGETPRGDDRGEPISGTTDINGEFAYPDNPKRIGVFTLEIEGPFVARLKSEPAETAKGNVVCKRLEGSSDFEVVVSPKPGTVQLEVIKQADASVLATTFVRIGLWDRAFDRTTGNLRNALAEANNFIGADTRRFHFRVRDPGAAGEVQIRWRTVFGDDSDDHAPASQDLTLTETGPGTRVFISRGVFVVTDGVDQTQATNSGLPAAHIDAGNRNEGESNHRIRRITVDDTHPLDSKIAAEYTPASGALVETIIPVFKRAPEERRRIRIHLINVRASVGGVGALTGVRRDLVKRTFQEIYARAGIFAEVNEILLDPPASCIGWPTRYPTDPIATDPSVEGFAFDAAGVNLLPSTTQLDVINAVRLLPAFDSNDIYIVCVARVYNAPIPPPPGPGLVSGGGEAFPDSFTAAGSVARGFGFVGVVSGITEYADVHEATHITTDLRNAAGGHFDLGLPPPAGGPGNIDGKNLMHRHFLANGLGVSDPKRLWNERFRNTNYAPALVLPAQIAAILERRFVHSF